MEEWEGRVMRKNNDPHFIFFNTIFFNDAKTLKKLISSGEDVDQKDCHGNRALHLVARNGYLECLRELILAGADINVQDDAGESPLHLAAQYGELNCVSELLEFGSKVSLINKNNMTPKDLARRYGHKKCSKVIERFELIEKEKEIFSSEIKISSSNLKKSLTL